MSEKQPPYRVLAWIAQHPWAMLPAAYDVMMEVVTRRFTGEMLPTEEKEARIEAARRQTPTPNAPGSIAILPVYGVIAPRAGAFEDVSQEGTSLKAWSAAFNEAVADPNITGIIGLFDTPGGSVYGLEETANLIYQARGRKPMTAMVENGMAASAGYHLASQFDELVVSPSSEVGSIGIITRHEDLSKMVEAMGVKVTFITAPEGGFKSEGNPFEPLSATAREHIQATLNAYYDTFVKVVARGRKASQTKVREDFGKGRMYTAERAVSLGMADRIATLQDVVDGMTGKDGKKKRMPMKMGMLAPGAGPVEAPSLREGSEAKSCMNCEYYSKPSASHDGGTCSRHDFHTMGMWLCDDWEMKETPAGEPMPETDADRERMARANLLLAGAHRGDAHP